jgi:tetratricopeptide (TPR) repeat protein
MSYKAFISYSHHDRRWARWLHKAIETYQIPPRIPGARLSPVFLDRAELTASPDLSAIVQSALEESEHLIVICSPDAARSRWVNQEIEQFIALGRRDRIHCLVVAGNPGSWTDESLPVSTHCFPPALKSRGAAAEARAIPEPLAVDVRPGMDDRQTAKLKIVAALLGVRLDDLRQRDQARRQQRLVAIAVASSLGALVLAGLSFFAFLSRSEALRARALAEQNALTAQRTSQFVVSLFSVSDPSEARGDSITAREILDRGVAQIQSQLEDEPQVRAELLTTLGNVYRNLGLLRPSAELLEEAVAVPGKTPPSEFNALLALAKSRYELGNYAESERLLRMAATSLEKAPESATHAANEVKLDLAVAETMLRMDRSAEGLASLQKTYLAARSLKPVDSEQLGRILEVLAEANFYEGHLTVARDSFVEALQVWNSLYGEVHPRVAFVLSQIGAVEYMLDRKSAALARYQKALPIERKTLGQKHPNVAVTMNNVARIHLERREFQMAATLLDEASQIQLAQKSELHDDLTFVFANLGLAKIGLEDVATGAEYLEKALRAARANNHRLIGPILVDLARIDCQGRRFDMGLRRLTEARPFMRERYPNDDWRSAIVDSVEGECWLAKGDHARAAPLLTGSAPILLAKWQPTELYGYETVQLMIRYYTVASDPSELARYRLLAQSGPSSRS